jgi:hypothetical protein
VQERYPKVKVEKTELGAGGAVGGYIRQNKVAGHPTRYVADGIVILVPYDRLGQVTGPSKVGGGWEMTIRFSARPLED